MSREFAVSAGGITVAGATTLLAIQPTTAPNFNIEFLRWWVGQSGSTTTAQQRVEIINKASVFPTLTSVTPTKLKVADPNNSIIAGNTAVIPGAVGMNASAEGGGAATVRWDDAFNVLNGWLHVPTPPETQIYPAGFTNSIQLYFPQSPTGTTGWAFGCTYREV